MQSVPVSLSLVCTCAYLLANMTLALCSQANFRIHLTSQLVTLEIMLMQRSKTELGKATDFYVMGILFRQMHHDKLLWKRIGQYLRNEEKYKPMMETT